MNLGERWTQRSRSNQTRTQRLWVQTWRPAECITTFFSKVSLPCVGGNVAWDLPNLKIKDLIIEYVEYDSPLVMVGPWWGLKPLLLSIPAPGLCSYFPSQQTMAPGGAGEHLGGTPPDRGWEPWYLPPPTPPASNIRRPCVQPVPAPVPRRGAAE